MPRTVNLPPPWVRRLAPAFNHHREISLLVMYEVHAIEYKTIGGGSRMDTDCQICQLTELLSSTIQRRGTMRRFGPELVGLTFWSRPPPSLSRGRTYHPVRRGAEGGN